jgi:hypothetical protein
MGSVDREHLKIYDKGKKRKIQNFESGMMGGGFILT